MLDWIKNRIAAAWRFSRTVFVNVAALAIPLLGELVAYLASVDWASLTANPRAGLAYTVVLTVVNIVLRYLTTGPVGGRSA